MSRSEPLPRPSSTGGSPRMLDYEEASEAGPLCLLGFYRPALTSRDGVILKVQYHAIMGVLDVH
jgi:hypothetical protein